MTIKEIYNRGDMLQIFIVSIAVCEFTIKKGYYNKREITEDDELSNFCSSSNNLYASLHRCSFEKDALEIKLNTIRIKSIKESLLIYYFDCDSNEHKLVESTDYYFYLRFSVLDDNGKISHYYDKLIGFGTDTITTRLQYYCYVKQLITDLLIFLYNNSFYQSINEITIDKKIKEVQDENLVNLYFFNKFDVNFKLRSISRIFKLILGPCGEFNLYEKSGFLIFNLEKFFLNILKENGDFFYDFRNYKKEKYERYLTDFLLLNIGLMVIDFTNLYNAIFKKLSLGDKGKYIHKNTMEIKEVLKKCVIITFHKHVNLLILLKSLKLSRFKNHFSEDILFYFDIDNRKLIIDLEDQINPLKEVFLSFISNSERIQKIISFDPVNIK